MNALSYLSHANNGGAGPNINAAWHIYGQLTGSNNLVVFGGDLSGTNDIACPSNTFSGQWILKAGYLVGSASNALGSNNIIVNPQYALPLNTAVNTAGPALLEVDYDLNSAGNLILTNGGQMRLHQNCIFGSVAIEGTSLSAGMHSYSELAGRFPNNFAAGGSGSITALSGPVPVPLSASFSGTPTNGVAPLLVTFTNTSTGSYTNSVWSFGDGGSVTNSGTTAVYAYNSPGTYTVTLTVNGPGGLGTCTQTNFVTVADPVQVGYVDSSHQSMLLSWSQGTLLEATNVSGPWITNIATSPLTVSPTNTQMFFCVNLGLSQNPYYPNNRAPLLETAYVKLPLGAVKPQGWLHDELVVQANGLTRYLPQVWNVVSDSSWIGDYGANVTECCWARFVPRWLNGLVRLAYELDDPGLEATANQYMGYLMTVQNPAQISPSLVAWSHLGRVLQAYYEATGDPRAIQLCRTILHYADSVRTSGDQSVFVPIRAGMLLGFSWWYYNQSGEADVLPLVGRVVQSDVDDWTNYFSHFPNQDDTARPGYPLYGGDEGRQGVDLTQAIEYPIGYYLMAKDQNYRNSVSLGINYLDTYDGQVGGRWNADEYLSGLKPTQGTELCDVEELIYSLTKNFEAIGDVTFADRVEKLMFNAFPATCTADMWSHQYDQQANQVLVSVAGRPWHGDDDTSSILGFTPNFPCCLANMHLPFPTYVENMWMASNDKGLVAALYGPCEVKAKVGTNIDADITEATGYPFSDVVVFTVNVSAPAAFPVYFRIPSWAQAAQLTVGGTVLNPAAGSVCQVNRTWQSGDVVTLQLNNQVQTETRYNNAASVTWGPLDFALRIGESFTSIGINEDQPLTPSFPTGVVNWQITPTTPWNYALVIDRNNPQYTIVTNAISQMPFAQIGEPVFLPGATNFTPWPQDVPMVLQMRARLVSNWGMNGASAADVPATPVASSTNNDTIVSLIPYGCTRLRIAEFPVISP